MPLAGIATFAAHLALFQAGGGNHLVAKGATGLEVLVAPLPHQAAGAVLLVLVQVNYPLVTNWAFGFSSPSAISVAHIVPA